MTPEVLAIAVGSVVYWRDGCAAPDPACVDPARELAYADDDARRAAFLLGAFADEVRVLAPAGQGGSDRAGLPTSSALLSTIDALLAAPSDRPRQLVVFLAAHATAEEVFLEDGRHPFEGLRREIRGRLGPADELLLISDACLSARWRGDAWGMRGAPRTGFPLVSPSPEGLVEIAVDSLTPEDPRLQGGVLSWLALSALVGASDGDGDGVVRAQEVSDFLNAYAAGLATPIAPVVRAPHALPGWPLPAPRSGGTLVVGGPDAARFVVMHADGTALLEAFAEAGGARALALPAGDYDVIEIPVALSEGTWRASGDMGWRRSVHVGARESTTLDAAPREPWPLARFRGGDEAPASQPWLVSIGPTALPRDVARQRAPGRTVLAAGGSGGLGASLEQRTLVGLSVRASGGPLGAGWVLARGGAEVPGGGMGALALGGGAELRVLGTVGLSASLSLGGGAEGARFRLADGTQRTVGPFATAGLVMALEPSASIWGVEAAFAWTPSAWLTTAREGEGTTLTPDLDRVTFDVRIRWRP